MRAQPVWIASLSAAALFACASPKPPTVVPQSVRVVGLSGAGVQLSVLLNVDNPNSFPLVAHKVDGELFVGMNDQKLGTGHAMPEHNIAAEATTTVTVELQIAWKDITALGSMMGQPSLPYRFAGHVAIGGESLNVTLPLELRGQLTREQLLTAGLRGLPSMTP